MNADRVSSLVWLLLGLVTIYGSFQLGLGTLHEPGSGFLAFLAGAFIVCVAGIIFVQSILRFRGTPLNIKSLWAGANWHHSLIIALFTLGFILALEGLDLSAWEHPHLGRPTRNVGTISGGTRINMVPDAAELTLDLRTLPAMDHAALFKLVQAAAPEVAGWEVLDDTRSLWTDPDHPWVRDTWAVTAAITGRQPAPGGAPFPPETIPRSCP